jgi:ABC-2 type transport system ATP-binding protein
MAHGLAIHTTGLSRHFGSIRAVENLDLEIPAGIIFGFLGPNGSGKTTTIRLLLGLHEPTAGTAQILYERLTAEENLDLFGRFWRIPVEARRDRTRHLLSQLDLWDRRDDIVAGWSRGMKQKLAIARSLFHHPSLLFLDEPTAGLDPVAAAALRHDLVTLAEADGVTVFLTTHNLAEAEKICSLVGVIRDGSLIAFAPPAELGKSGMTLEDSFLSLMASQ